MIYIDTSVIVPIFLNAPFVGKAKAILSRGNLLLSTWALAEFAGVVTLRLRERQLSAAQARAVLATLDSWAAAVTQNVDTEAQDIRAAETFLRRLDLNLRAPDAVHLAIAQRSSAELATFDKKLAAAARNVGMTVVS